MKKLILSIIYGLTCFFFWLKIGPWITDPFDFQETSRWLWPLVLLVSNVALAGLAFLFFNPKHWAWLIPGLNILSFFLVFFVWPDAILLGGLVIFVFFHWLAMISVNEEKNNRLKLNLKESLRCGSYRLVTASLILISFVYFLTPGVQQLATAQTLPSKAAKVIQSTAERYLEGAQVVFDPAIKKQITQEVLNKINVFLKPYFQFLPSVLSFGLFLALQGLSFLFVWLALLLSWILFLALRTLRVVTVSKVSKEAEVLIF